MLQNFMLQFVVFAGSPVTTTRLLSLCSGHPPPPCPGQAADTRVTRVMLLVTVFALAVMENAVGVSKFGKNPMTLLVHQY